MFVHDLNMQELQHPVHHLTDNYRKDENSNNYKILDLGHREHKEIMRNLRLIQLWRDMDNAEGFTLDKIGKNVLELREGRDDPEYRKAIKIKIRGNLSAGTIEDFNAICGILFDENFIGISEAWHQEMYNFEPAAVVLTVSYLAQEQVEFFLRERAILENIVKAGGVRIYCTVSTEHSEMSTLFKIGGFAFPATSTTELPPYQPPIRFEQQIGIGGVAFPAVTETILPQYRPPQNFSAEIHIGGMTFPAVTEAILPQYKPSHNFSAKIRIGANAWSISQTDLPPSTMKGR